MVVVVCIFVSIRVVASKCDHATIFFFLFYTRVLLVCCIANGNFYSFIFPKNFKLFLMDMVFRIVRSYVFIV